MRRGRPCHRRALPEPDASTAGGIARVQPVESSLEEAALFGGDGGYSAAPDGGDANAALSTVEAAALMASGDGEENNPYADGEASSRCSRCGCRLRGRGSLWGARARAPIWAGTAPLAVPPSIPRSLGNAAVTHGSSRHMRWYASAYAPCLRPPLSSTPRPSLARRPSLPEALPRAGASPGASGGPGASDGAGAPALEALLAAAEAGRAPGMEDLLGIFPYALDAFQKRAVEALLAGRSVVVCAPTGAGAGGAASGAGPGAGARAWRPHPWAVCGKGALQRGAPHPAHLRCAAAWRAAEQWVEPHSRGRRAPPLSSLWAGPRLTPLHPRPSNLSPFQPIAAPPPFQPIPSNLSPPRSS